MARPRVLVVGSSNVDFIMALERLPDVGETVTDGQFFQTFGGKGANQAVASARAGGDVTFVTGVGNDTFGAQMIHNFAVEGMDTTRVVRAKTPSGSALVMFDTQGRNYLSVAPGANYALRPEHLDVAPFAQADVVVMQMEIPVDTTLRALQLAREAETPVVFNFAPVKTREVPVSDAMTILVVNEHEAATLCDFPVNDAQDAQEAARALKLRGPRIVMVTLGDQGVVLAGDEELHVPAFKVAARDTTAAGDTFCGAFAVAWSERRALREAVEFASAAAALSVTREGAQPSIPRRAEIEALLI